MHGQQRAMANGRTIRQSLATPTLMCEVVEVKHRLAGCYTTCVADRLILQLRVIFAKHIEHITIHHSCTTVPYMNTSTGFARSASKLTVASQAKPSIVLLPIRKK